MKLVKLLLAFIVLVLVSAPAAAQDSRFPAVENVRFTDNAGAFAWDKPAGEIRSFTIDVDRSETSSFRNYRWERAGKDAVSGKIRFFDRSYNWRVRVRAIYAAGDYATRAGDWSEWAYSYAPAPTPAEALATDTPSASYRSSYYQNRSVYEAKSCADRQEFRRCRQTCLSADPANCWGATCGPWLVGVAAVPSCATQAGAAMATATVAPSGSVSCENEVIAGENGFRCTFTLQNSAVAYQAVGWMDHPDVEEPVFGYRESEDGRFSLRVLPEECGKTFEGRAIAFAITLKYLATVDFTHKAICSLSTDTPVPATATETPIPPTDTPTATATATPVTPTDTSTATPVTPTATPTATPVTPTDTSTATPVTPTDTPTATPVTPTDTPTATATATPLPPTATPTPTATPQKLAAPTNLRRTGDLTIAWDAVTGAIAYHVRVKYAGGSWNSSYPDETQFTFATAGNYGSYEITVTSVGDGSAYEWQGGTATLQVSLVKPTATPTSTPTATPVTPTDTPTATPVTPTSTPRPRDTDPPPRDTDPPPPATNTPKPACQPRENCSASSGVWSVYDERTVHDGPVCAIVRYERRLQQYTCTNSCTREQTRQYNQIVQDWTEISRRGC